MKNADFNSIETFLADRRSGAMTKHAEIGIALMKNEQYRIALELYVSRIPEYKIGCTPVTHCLKWLNRLLAFRTSW